MKPGIAPLSNDFNKLWTFPPRFKGFTNGTHREDEPRKLLEALRIDLERFAITRVGRITGLDRIGVEVFAAYRPNGRGLSVAQGKGCTRDEAELSAIMEAIELSHAETANCPIYFGQRDCSASAFSVDTLNRLANAPLQNSSIFWADGFELIGRRVCRVPFDLVHACFTEEARTGGPRFPVSTNGLASGANREEALLHAVCELVERYHTALLQDLGDESRASRILNFKTITDPSASKLVDQFHLAEMSVTVWDSTCHIGLPSCVAAISDAKNPNTPPGYGAGCHTNPHVAFCRALTEAAQSRLTRISGARDDLTPEKFSAQELLRARWLSRPRNGQRGFEALPDVSTDRLDVDLERALQALVTAGFSKVVALELSADPRFSVVRAIVPELLGREAAW